MDNDQNDWKRGADKLLTEMSAAYDPGLLFTGFSGGEKRNETYHVE